MTVKWPLSISWGAVEILLILAIWLFLTYSFTRFVNSDKSPIFVNWKKCLKNILATCIKCNFLIFKITVLLTLASLNLTVSNLLNNELSFPWFTFGPRRTVNRAWTRRGCPGCKPVLIRQIVSPSHISVILISTSAPFNSSEIIFF